MRARERENRGSTPGAGVLSAVTRTYLDRSHSIEEELVRSLREAPMTDSPSYCCVAHLLPQTRATVAMAENLLRYTTWVPLEQLAERMILEENEWRADLIGVWERCEGEASGADAVTLYRRCSESVIEDMGRRLRQMRPDNSLNADFLRTMLILKEGEAELSNLAEQMPLILPLRTLLERRAPLRGRQLASLRGLLRQVPPC